MASTDAIARKYDRAQNSACHAADFKSIKEAFAKTTMKQITFMALIGTFSLSLPLSSPLSLSLIPSLLN
jgi:hypothetical protein